MYHFFYLEIALREASDSNIYAFENVSHIPTGKLIEIFNIDVTLDPSIVEGYVLTKAIYNRHKEYLDKHVGALNLEVFEYCLRLYTSSDFKEVRKLYKTHLME